jgi:GH18 family chitinase
LVRGFSWSYDAAKREMISYDTPAILVKKARLIHRQRLGGEAASAGSRGVCGG